MSIKTVFITATYFYIFSDSFWVEFLLAYCLPIVNEVIAYANTNIEHSQQKRALNCFPYDSSRTGFPLSFHLFGQQFVVFLVCEVATSISCSDYFQVSWSVWYFGNPISLCETSNPLEDQWILLGQAAWFNLRLASIHIGSGRFSL